MSRQLWQSGRTEDPRLTELTKIALGLPEAKRQVCGRHVQFLIRKKTFAYFLDDHHGDGIVAVTGKVLPGDNQALAEAQSRRFYLPAYIASKGWVDESNRRDSWITGYSEVYSRPEVGC